MLRQHITLIWNANYVIIKLFSSTFVREHCSNSGLHNDTNVPPRLQINAMEDGNVVINMMTIAEMMFPRDFTITCGVSSKG